MDVIPNLTMGIKKCNVKCGRYKSFGGKMKNTTKLLSLIFSVFVLLFAGCSNLVDSGTSSEISANTNKSTKRSLRIYATGDEKNITFAPASTGDAKTILPAALDGNALDLWLWYQDKIATSDPDTVSEPKKYDFFSTTEDYGRKGTIELDMPTSQYLIYLVAVDKGAITTPAGGTNKAKADDVKAQALLYATATVDMRYSESVSFYLTPYTLSGDADVKIQLQTVWNVREPFNKADHIVAGIYDINTNAVIGTAEAKNTAFTKNNPLTATDLTLNVSDVPAGTYTFKVEFIDDSVSPAKSYYYTDNIVILANQNIDTTISIPNYIGNAPAQPEKFHVSYVDPDTYVSNYYDAVFTWEDKSNNEQYFKLQLMDITSLNSSNDTNIAAVTAAKDESPAATTQAAADAAWTTAVSGLENKVAVNDIITFDQTVYSDGNYYEAGSLGANQQMVVLRLPLGRRYLARIAAANGSGASKYTYLAISEDPTSDAGLTAYNKLDTTAVALSDIKRFDEASTCINRFRVSYNLAGGSYKVGTYDSTSKALTSVSNTEATKTDIPSLTGTLDVDVKYYTQLGYVKLTAEPADWAKYFTPYFTESSGTYTALAAAATFAGTDYYSKGNQILNPLYVKTAVVAGTDYYALTNGKYHFNSWKLDSSSGKTVYKVDNNTTTQGCAAPLQTLRSTTEGESLGYKTYYEGFENIQLFASYNSMGVVLYNPADYQLLDRDVLVFKSDNATPAISNAVQVSAIDEAGGFTVSNGASGYKNVYIAVRNNSSYVTYDRIALDVYKQKQGKISSQIVNVGATGTFVSETANRYVLLTKEPDDFSTNFANYYTKSGMEYTALAAAGTFAQNTYYYVDSVSKSAQDFTYFDLPVRTGNYGNGSYLITVTAYTSKNAKTGLTKVLTMNVQDGSGTYSLSTFKPIDVATAGLAAAGNYFDDNVGTNAVAWAAGVYQKD